MMYDIDVEARGRRCGLGGPTASVLTTGDAQRLPLAFSLVVGRMKFFTMITLVAVQNGRRTLLARAVHLYLTIVSYLYKGIKTMCYETLGLMMAVQGGAVVIGEREPVVGGIRAKRGKVGTFSDSARKRLLRFCSSSAARFSTMATFTIPYVEFDGEAFKYRLDRLLVWLRASAEIDFPLQSWTALWVLEFQGRGAAHVHVLLTHPVNKDVLRAHWVSLWRRRIEGVVAEGGVVQTILRHELGKYADNPASASSMLAKMERSSSFVEKLRNRGESMQYVAKYAAKNASKILPLGMVGFGRWWGVRGDATVMTRDCMESWPLPLDPGHRIEFLKSFWAGCVEVSSAWRGFCRLFPWKRGYGVTILQQCDDDVWARIVQGYRELAVIYAFFPCGLKRPAQEASACMFLGGEVEWA